MRATSRENPTERTSIPATLEVLATLALEVGLSPQRATSTRDGVFQVRLVNPSNADLTIELSATDPEEGCAYRFEPQRATVGAGQSKAVTLRVSPKASPRRGEVRRYDFTVKAVPIEAPAQAQAVMGSLEHRSALPKWALPAAIVVALLLCCGAASVAGFALLGDEVRDFLAGLRGPTLTPVEVAVATQIPVAGEDPATQTALAQAMAGTQTAQAAGTQTAVAGENSATQTAVAESMAATQTAAAGQMAAAQTAQAESLAATQTAVAGENSATQTAVAESIAATETTAAAEAAATQTAQAQAESDADGDGLTYAQETELGTFADNPDSDGDGILDGEDPDPLQPAKPDLTVTGLSLVEGNRIQCSYQNIGDAEVPQQEVWIEIHVAGARVTRSNIGVGRTFPAGSGGWLQMAVPPGVSGSVSVKCVIDADNDVAEADEGNNELVRPLTLAPSVKTVTLRSIDAEDGIVYNTGQVFNTTPSAGDTVQNGAIRGFLSYDISAIPPTAALVEAMLDLTTATRQGNPSREALGSFEVYSYQYGTLDVRDFDGGPAALVRGGRFTPDNLFPIDIRDSVQEQVRARQRRFQLRLQFSKLTNNDGVLDLVGFPVRPPLTIQYTE